VFSTKRIIEAKQLLPTQLIATTDAPHGSSITLKTPTKKRVAKNQNSCHCPPKLVQIEFFLSEM
jgi:hypothetical protein